MNAIDFSGWEALRATQSNLYASTDDLLPVNMSNGGILITHTDFITKYAGSDDTKLVKTKADNANVVEISKTTPTTTGEKKFLTTVLPDADGNYKITSIPSEVDYYLRVASS